MFLFVAQMIMKDNETRKDDRTFEQDFSWLQGLVVSPILSALSLVARNDA